MTARERWYHLALRAYPRGFRQIHGEEMLTTVFDMREAGKVRGRVRDLVSLVFNGGRQKWLESTGGSLAATLRQGLAWGALVLVARQVGLAAQDVFEPLIRGYHNDPFVILLLVGWLVTFCVLAGGSRRWGLIALTVTLVGFVYYRVHMALGYGGRFDLPWTLGFSVPVVLPLLAAYAWPERGVKLRIRWWPLWLVPAAALSPLSVLGGPWGLWFDHRFFQWLLVGIGLVTGGLAIAAGLSDPRWLATACLLFCAYWAKDVVPIASGRSLALGALVPLVLFWVIAPVVALLLARRVRKRAVRAE
jgi:hypothetical protein